MQEVIMTGKTVDDAIELACKELGVARDDINLSIEIIDMPQKRLFGSTPAKVRVVVNEDEISVKDLIAGLEEKPKAKPEAPPEQPKPERQAKPKKQNEQPQPQQSEKRSEPLPSPIEFAPRSEQDKLAIEDLPVGAAAAFAYLREVAEKMGLTDIEYEAYKTESGGVEFVVSGEQAPALIGRRGETMDALQYLALLVSNRAADGEYCKITLDIANYRQKRAQTLESLAQRMAGKAKKSRRSQTLEPMNPYERRIVHSAIQGIEGVRSESIGEEPRRRVVVMLEGDTRPPQRSSGGGNRNRRGGSGGGNNRSRSNSPQQPRREQSAPQPKKEADPEAEKNLYKKIEL